MEPSPHIPGELSDMIIDHLHDDKQALDNCSVVCPYWRQSARYHLFHTITIQPKSLTGGFDDFLHFIASSASIQPLVQKLHLKGRDEPHDGFHNQLCHIGPSLLRFILHHLPALRILGLDNVSWNERLTSPSPLSVPTWRTTSRCLSSFTLHRVHVIKSENLELTQPAQPLVEASDSLTQEKVHPSSATNLLPEIRHLTISGNCGNKAFVKMIRGSRTLETLRSLHLQSSGVADAYCYRTLLWDLAAVLFRLEIDLLDCRRPIYLAHQTLKNTFSAGISRCLSLKELDVQLSVDHDPSSRFINEYRSGWPYLPALLLDLPESIRAVVVTLLVPPKAKVDEVLQMMGGVDWVEVEDALCNLPNLLTTRFVIRGQCEELGPVVLGKVSSDIKAALCLAFPRLVSSKRFHVLEE